MKMCKILRNSYKNENLKSDKDVFGVMFTYCDVQKIKPICLAVPEPCENSCNVQSRKLKQQNRSPTGHFDVLPTWVKYCPILTNNHHPYVIQDRTRYSKCSVHLDQECLQSFPTKGVISFTRHQKNRVKMEGLIVSTTPEPQVKQKSSREPDFPKKRGGLQ